MTSKLLIEKIKHIGVEEWRLAAEKIEKDLEVLEIIKEKQVDIFYINVCKNAESYNKYKTSIKKLTNNEFYKIKKTLEVKDKQ